MIDIDGFISASLAGVAGLIFVAALGGRFGVALTFGVMVFVFALLVVANLLEDEDDGDQ